MLFYGANILINYRKRNNSSFFLCFIDNQNLVMNSTTILSFSDGLAIAPSR